jgi:hypothetical protein
MNAPVGPLLRTLAERILANLDLIGQQDADFGDMDQNRAPYPDTQLLISLLGVLVFPHERTPGALGRLLKNYEALSNVVTIRYPKLNQSDIELVEASGERHRIDPTSIEELPRLLRNSIAHFNILPLVRTAVLRASAFGTKMRKAELRWSLISTLILCGRWPVTFLMRSLTHKVI